VAELGVCAQAAADELAELLAVLVGQHALEALHQVAGDAVLVGAGLVSEDDADAGAPERVLVEGGLIRLEAREPTDVVAQDYVGLAHAGLRADVEEGQEVPPPHASNPVQSPSSATRPHPPPAINGDLVDARLVGRELATGKVRPWPVIVARTSTVPVSISPPARAAISSIGPELPSPRRHPPASPSARTSRHTHRPP
jgi:hypothetical protein